MQDVNPSENTPPQISVVDGTLTVTGTLTFESVVKIWKLGLQAIRSIQTQTPIQVNLEGLRQSDSSGLALWSSWMRAAYRQKKSLRFVNIPAFMQDLIRVHGLEAILPT